MNKKRTISYVTLLILIISFLGVLTGCGDSEKIPIPTPKEDTFIYDENDSIDDDVESELNKLLIKLEEKTEVEFVVVSVSSLHDHSIEDYSHTVFNTLGIGKRGKDNGLLLLFSKSDNRVRLEVGRSLEGILNDAKCGRILDKDFVPYRNKAQYTQATEYTVKAILNTLAEEYDVEIEGLERMTNEDTDEANSGISLWGWIIIFILILIVIVFTEINSGGGSSGGYYGGGYHGGSFSSGTSFGGFGGGFSGGGGASR